MLLESLHQSSLNFVSVACYLSVSHWGTQEIRLINSTNNTASQAVEILPLILLEFMNRSS
jgi:hypothetical protein